MMKLTTVSLIDQLINWMKIWGEFFSFAITEEKREREKNIYL